MKYTNTEYQELRNKIWADLVSSGVTSDEDENYTSFDNILGSHLPVDWDETLNKVEKIKYIKEIISKYGSFSTAESSPVINVLNNQSLLVEYFGYDNVTAFLYVHSTCVSEEDIKYEDLDEEVINDICTLVESWEAEQQELIED